MVSEQSSLLGKSSEAILRYRKYNLVFNGRNAIGSLHAACFI